MYFDSVYCFESMLAIEELSFDLDRHIQCDVEFKCGGSLRADRERQGMDDLEGTASWTCSTKICTDWESVQYKPRESVQPINAIKSG